MPARSLAPFPSHLVDAGGEAGFFNLDSVACVAPIQVKPGSNEQYLRN
jgi:hypothetical protein